MKKKGGASLSGSQSPGETGIHSSALGHPLCLECLVFIFHGRARLSDAGSGRADGCLSLGLGLAGWPEQEGNGGSRISGRRIQKW